MAHIHTMPPDTREKEKIIGGILEMRQLLCLIVGSGLGAVVTVSTFRFLGAFSLILFIPFFAASLPFAFKTVEDMDLMTYLRYRFRYKRKIKHYVNKGCHEELEFSVNEL